MKQLAQKLKNGRMEVVEVPVPLVSKGALLVQNAYSVISSGTESSTVKAARKGLIGKAVERPRQAQQMLDLLRVSGPVQAYRTFEKKLESFSALGYSCAGRVIELGENVSGFAVGDKVACAGSGANHAEFVVVPKNLCVKLAPDADLKNAAYNTLGAIALQGARQADLRIAESCAVIGLGILGQLTCLLLKAGGIRVVGIDINPEMVTLAKKHALDFIFLRDEAGIYEKVEELSGGIGVDAVIITAATKSLDPVNFAGRILKQRGRVVIVGDVPTGFDREPFYYRKELDLRMSCSYGPGRYDPVYEQKGIDYPPAYVRWTERRNMEAFQELIHIKRVDISPLTTHVFKLKDANSAYHLIMEGTEPHLGILLEYDGQAKVSRKVELGIARPACKKDEVSIAFIGAGSYAMSHLLPNIPKTDWIRKKAIMTASGLNSRSAAERFQFEFCASSQDEIFTNDDINTVFIATRHDAHAHYVTEALKSGKNVFVEKPLCTTENELCQILDMRNAVRGDGASIDNRNKALNRKDGLPILMVGFNRRFSPLTAFVRETMGCGPMAMIYRINAGTIPSDSWIQDKEIGGGRIIGEVCHFIDLLTFLNGSLPEKVQAFAMREASGQEDTLTVNIRFANDSIAAISYFANGSKKLPKEYIEIYRTGCTAIMRDFRQAEILSSKKRISKKLLFQDKGQAAAVNAFLKAVKNGDKPPIRMEEISAVTLATLKAAESLRTDTVMSV